MKQEDRGFTLVELVIAITLSLMIGGVVVSALLTSLNVSNSVSAQVGDSTDAGLITAYLTRDAQSAGGIVPTTAIKDASVGVSIVNTAVGWAGCQPPGTMIVRFSWIERTSTLASSASTVVVTYGFDSTAASLTRRLCRTSSDSTTVSSEVVLGRDIKTISASCNVACTGTPTFVSLAVTGTGTRAPLAYTLKASLRGDTQAALTLLNTTPVPLLALGAGAAVACPNVQMIGTGVVTVVGNALVDSLCTTGTPITDTSGLLRPTGTASTVAGITDPYATRTKPAFTCPASGTNPTTGVSATAATIVVYPNLVTVTSDTAFSPGRFIFCKGLLISSGRITGTDVLLYIDTGTFEVAANATVNLTGRTSVPATDKQLLVWSAEANKPIKIAAGAKVSSYRGLIYAPTSRMELSSVLGGNIGSINTQGLKVTGAGQARIGLTIPVIAVAPATTLTAGQVNVAYSNSSLVASGGTAPYTWSAANLPPGLTMSSTGVITGTPTTAGPFAAIVVTVFDATKAAASFDYSSTITAALSIAAAPVLPNGQVGAAYATTTLTPIGGTAPYTWTQTGLPAGLSISTAGVVSGTPTASGTFSVIVTVTDAYTSAQKTYTVVITSALAVAGPALPNGQINVAYGPTTVTATGGAAPLSWTASGLPAGLSINASTGTVSGTPTVSGNFTVTVTVTDATTASAQAVYPVSIIATPTTTCPAYLIPWNAQYYSNVNLSGTPVLVRDDATPTNDWGTNSPGSGVPADNFSARWTRTTDFGAGNHAFGLSTSDGGRLYVDGVLLINNWVDQEYPPTPTMYTKNLTAGSHTITVEYYERTGSARVGLIMTLPGNGVTAVAGTCNDRTYFGESRIMFSNSLPVTSMTITVRVAITAGVTFNGNYVTFEGGNVSISHTTSGGFIVYTFTLDAGKTIVPGSWIVAAQWNGTGTLHATSGDTWTVVTTTTGTGGGTATLNGVF